MSAAIHTCGVVEATNDERGAFAVRCIDGTWLYARAADERDPPRPGDAVRCDNCGHARVLYVVTRTGGFREIRLDNAISGLPAAVAKELLGRRVG